MQGVTQNETDLLTAIKEIIDNSQDNFNRLYLDGDPIVELGKKYYEEFSTIKLVGFKQIGKRFSPIFGNDEIPNHDEYYYDKKKERKNGVFYGKDLSNDKVIERLKKYLERKLQVNPLWPQIAEDYRKVPIDKIIDYLTKHYGKR